MSPFATRFAPSPTGRLHRGHAFSALTGFEAARSAGGRFVLRLEDIDTTRCRPVFEAGILQDLAWLGLTWETPVLRQSEHLPDYLAALRSLRNRGLTYRCFRSRKEVAQAMMSAPHGAMEVFRGGPLAAEDEARRLAEGQPYAWRLSLLAAEAALGGFEALGFREEGTSPAGECGDIAARPALGGDVILARKDVGVAYHLAVTVDDARQGVSHVIRGQDLFDATHVQCLLQSLLNLPRPTYRHHALMVGPDGLRLSKRNDAETLENLRAQGVTAKDLRRELGFD